MQFPLGEVWVSKQVQIIVGKGDCIVHPPQKPDGSKLLQQETAFHAHVHQAGLLSAFSPARRVYTNPGGQHEI